MHATAFLSLSSVKPNSLDSLWNILLLFQISFQHKRSYEVSWKEERIRTTFRSFSDTSAYPQRYKAFDRVAEPKPVDKILDEAIRRAFTAFELPQRPKMLHLNDVFQRESPIWNSSPGLPWIELGYKKKSHIREDPDAIRRIRWFWQRVKAGEDIRFPDCCAYVRAGLPRHLDLWRSSIRRSSVGCISTD